MSRWVRVQTSIFDHELFAAEPFSEREAWLWMITRAAWKDTVHRVGADVVKVPAGSFFATIRDMQSVWRWKSTTRVQSFLKMLEAQNMISVSAKTGKTHVTVCNYAKYQSGKDSEKTPEIQAEDSENTQKIPVLPEHHNSAGLLGAQDVLDPVFLESKLREAAGDKIQPSGGFIVGPIMELINAGADLDLDVLPTIRSSAAKLQRPARSWQYFVAPIQDAFDRRKAAGTWDRTQPRQQAPPGKSAFQQRHQSAIDAFDKFDRQSGSPSDDEFTGTTLDLGARDFHSH